MCQILESMWSPNRHSAFEKVIIEGATSTHVALLLYSRILSTSSWVSLSFVRS